MTEEKTQTNAELDNKKLSNAELSDKKSSNTLSDLINGDKFDDEFLKFDLTEIQSVLSALKSEEAIDIAHAEHLQRKALRGADIVSEYLGIITKMISHYESKLNSAKNKASLNYVAAEGRTTAEMKKWAGECSPDIEPWQDKLAKAKAGKVVLSNKFDILIREHHQYKEIASGMRRGIVSVPNSNASEDWK